MEILIDFIILNGIGCGIVAVIYIIVCMPDCN